ncbi:glycerate kinase I [Serratia rubidaea]|uniref:Glycerate kinase I n=1 Tax=Serratia rubidaea TaxID=61652 RepID=A0A3S4GL61_SERRU|nr:glycerate kinase I [Serratia rubidaea]
MTNPLTGPEGASAIFGPQKGATPQMVASWTARWPLCAGDQAHAGVDVDQVPGAGAAGGMGAGLLAFCRAELRQGIEIVTEALGLDALVRDATLVITGEGRIDTARASKARCRLAWRGRQTLRQAGDRIAAA